VITKSVTSADRLGIPRDEAGQTGVPDRRAVPD
jgi:hypothetical protein